nr:2-C-methyl-D-erythritol 2,4-cyclodiphosphate synthase [Klebsiella pneumoniae]
LTSGYFVVEDGGRLNFHQCGHSVPTRRSSGRLGDIGKLFPDTDPAFKGADSRELLREAWRRIQARGYTLGNVDVTIIAQAPKMLPHIPQMRVFIAEDLGCHMDDVNVKATTTEKLGFTGRGEGIACEAVALLRKADK